MKQNAWRAWWWNKRNYLKYQTRLSWRLVGSPRKLRRYRRWERHRQGYYAYLEALRQTKSEKERWIRRQNYRAFVRRHQDRALRTLTDYRGPKDDKRAMGRDIDGERIACLSGLHGGRTVAGGMESPLERSTEFVSFAAPKGRRLLVAMISEARATAPEFIG